MLKPQDTLIAAAVGRHPRGCFKQWSQAVGLSLSEAYASVSRLEASGLIGPERRLNITLFVQFVENAMRIVWPQRFLGPGFGLPTGSAAPMLESPMPDYGSLPPVWPASRVAPAHLKQGLLVDPLYERMPAAVVNDEGMYALCAALESARSKSARERNAAVAVFRSRLLNYRPHEHAQVSS